MRALYVADAGAITSIGHDLSRTIASLRAGLDLFRRLPFQGEAGADLRAAPVAGYAEGLYGVPRYQALAVRALQPLVTRIPAEHRKRVRLTLGLPRPDRPGVPFGLGKQLTDRLARVLELDPARIQCVERGRPSVFLGLAQPGLAQDRETIDIVGGVDVLTDPDSLAALSHALMLKEDWDGFIPGDAAAFFRVANGRGPGYWQRPAARIAGLGWVEDPADGTKDNPRIGKGLAKAYAAAVLDAGTMEGTIDLRVNDLNGERSWFEDDGMAFTRYFRTPRPSHIEVWHLGSYVGETGAAAGALEILWTTAALELGFTPATSVMLSCSEDHNRTAAVVVATPDDRRASVSLAAVSGTRLAVHARAVREPIEVPDPGLRLDVVDNTARTLAELDLDLAASLLLVRRGHLVDPFAPWEDIEGFERRLLAHVDSLGWSQDAARPVALELLAERPEPEAAGVAAMLLGSSPLDDAAVAALLEALGAAPPADKEEEEVVDADDVEDENAITDRTPELPEEEDEERRARAEFVAEALGLCSSADARRVLEAALQAEAPSEVASRALRALLLGGKLEAQHLERLIAAERVDLLPTLFEITAAAGLKQLVRPLSELHRAARIELSLADMRGYVALSPASGPLPLFPLQTYVAEAPLLAALHCLRGGARLLAALSPDDGLTAEQVLALGWSGETDAVPHLLRLLGGDEIIAAAAASALELIVGAGLYDTVELEDDDEDAKDDPVKADPVSADRLSVDPLRWARAYEALGVRSGERLRHGTKWTQRSALMHLGRARASGQERTMACWEFAIVTGAGFPLHPEQLVVRQREQLAAALEKFPRT